MNTASQDAIPAPAERPSLQRTSSLAWFAERYALVALLLALVIFFAVYSGTSETFLTAVNLRNVAGNESVIALAALAAMVPLISGQFDVSVGAVLGMAQIVTASAMAHGLPLYLAVVIALICAAIVGLVNGWLVAYIGTNSFIITLASATLVGGLVSLYSHDQVILQGISPSLVAFGSLNFLGIPRVVWLVGAAALILGYGLGWTVPGRVLTSVGSNARAAGLVGMPVKRAVLSSFVVCALLAGIAGVLQVARTGTGNPAIGSSYTLSALSAAFLGATTLRPGRFNVAGTLVGVAFVALSVNGLTLAGVADWVDPVFTGAALTIAVAVSTVFGRQRGTQRTL
ncbi:ABC transporter permease [Streptomyces sp. NPDC101225]|uniref:ABC transporter permease n=1 Tax=Streptomyces sp. NPDC101225 TaxID=3366135 RepID=UPI0037F470C0